MNTTLERNLETLTITKGANIMENNIEENNLLEKLGNWLDGIDDVQERNFAGFSKPDKDNWQFRVCGDNSAMKTILKKYKRQISAEYGADVYDSITWENLPPTPNDFGRCVIRKNTQGEFTIRHMYSDVMNGQYRIIGAFWDRELKCRKVKNPHKVDKIISAIKSNHPNWVVDMNFDLNEESKNAKPEAPTFDVTVDYGDNPSTPTNRYKIKTNFSADVNTGFRNISEILKWEMKEKLRSCDSYVAIESAISMIKSVMPKWTINITDAYKKAKELEISTNSSLRKPIEELLPFLKPNIELFPYQNEGVRFLNEMDGKSLLGDEMGLGKTLQALAYARMNDLRVLVVCPNTVKQHWIDEAHEFFHGFHGAILTPKTVNCLGEYNIMSINYESLKKYTEHIKEGAFDLLILDESHKIKSPSAKRTKLLLSLRDNFNHVICITGTAIKNKKDELYCQAKMITNIFESQRQMKYSTISGMWEKMKTFYIRRTKEAELKHLPPKLRSKVSSDVTVDSLTKFTLDKTGYSDFNIGSFSQYRHYVAKQKIPFTIDFIKEMLDSGEKKVIMYTESVDVANEIYKAFESVAVLHTGEVKQDKKEIAKKSFRDDTNIKLFVATRSSAGEGINELVVSNKFIFNDLPWNPADLKQAEDRIHRNGQKSTDCCNYYNICAGEWDEYLHDMIMKKMKLEKMVLEHKRLSEEERTILATSVETLMKNKFSHSPKKTK